MTEHRHYSGPDLAPLLRRVRDELGSDAEIIRAERIRTGGLAGFFAREHYEVVAKRPKVDASAPPEPTPPAEVKPNGAEEPVADEPISRSASPAGPMVAAGGSGRSIQAALLDRADRVSTEELLVRVAETHSADWESESFQSILGRAMVEAVDPVADGASIADRRRDLAQIETRPNRPDNSIDGLRLESIQPGDNVIDPVPDPAPVEPSVAEGGGGHREREPGPDESVSPMAADDGGRGESDGHVPPQWADGVAMAWGPWMPGWAPWMINGWPGQSPDDRVSGSTPHQLCAKCAEPIPADNADDTSEPLTFEAGPIEEPEDAESWSELRREIDEVRLRLDNIIGTIRHATADENVGWDPDSPETGLDDEEPRPGRRDKDNRRFGRAGR